MWITGTTRPIFVTKTPLYLKDTKKEPVNCTVIYTSIRKFGIKFVCVWPFDFQQSTSTSISSNIRCVTSGVARFCGAQASNHNGRQLQNLRTAKKKNIII